MDKRVQQLNERPFRKEGKYVLYWAQVNRRVESNHGLLYAAELANERGIPVLFYEGLTCSYPYANDRMHTFVLEGVPETARRAARLGIGYCFHLRRRQADPDDAVYRLAREAAAVVTDDYPVFLARRHNASVPEKVDIPYFAVDSSCIVPMAEMTKREWAAYTIRPKIGRLMSKWRRAAPEVKVKRAFEGGLPELHTVVTEENVGELVSGCEIDHSVRPSLSYRGGRAAAGRRLRVFVEENLRLYAREKNEPAAHATSNLSPYLHFGHISSLEVALAVREYAKEHQLIAEEFLEELIVRRELAFNYARFSEDPSSFENLPEWARKTLSKHAMDNREPCYGREEFERAQTHDSLWNAAQKELLLRGKIHGYYRMYWGKKIIEWSRTHQDALETMIYLHDRYALDGRDPNTYANILWCFGLHDRPWGEREVLGTVRYLSLDGMKRKTDVEAYLREIQQMESTGVDPFRIQ